MNEIRRIHLAKTPYNIENEAAKELDAYEEAVRRSLADDEAESVMADIELRMVELLAERKVMADGVITAADVAALKDRLGAPADFGDENADPAMELPLEQKRLYRNTDEALLGGVAAGFATYFGIDKVWVRIAFVVLTLMSFGTGVFLYLILWIITPPARTAAEKLQMQGKSVTVESLKEYGAAAVEKVKQQQHIVPHAKRTLSVVAGIILVLCAIGSFMATVFGSVALLAFMQINQLETMMAYASLGLFVLAGLMLTWLLVGLAVALFVKKMSSVSRLVLIIVAVTGAFAFFGAVIAAWLAFGTAHVPVREYVEVPQADVRLMIDLIRGVHDRS